MRQTLELRTVRLAAERGTDADIAAIRKVYDHLVDVADDPEAAAAADVEFHRAIARATENELYLVLVDSLGDVLMEIRRATMGRPGRIREALVQHSRILEALERRDAEAAVEAMRDHLTDSYDAFRSTLEMP